MNYAGRGDLFDGLSIWQEEKYRSCEYEMPAMMGCTFGVYRCFKLWIERGRYIMIVKQYIKDFEKLGFGMFVHFGLYSMIGKGEWTKVCNNMTDEEYVPLAEKFNPKSDWATELVQTAKAAGCT